MKTFAMATATSNMPVLALVDRILAAKVGQAFLPAAQTGMSAPPSVSALEGDHKPTEDRSVRPVVTHDYRKNLPISDITLARQQPIVALVDRILAAKAATPAADISPLETEIDRLVSALYGTHAPETAIVEDK